MNTDTPHHIARRRTLGFSLIELMIAMTLGLILLAGVSVVFISTQQSGQTKRALDNAQEALRYAHYSVSRIVRVGEIDRTLSDGTTLVIIFDRDAASPDCLGDTTATADVAVTFTRDALNDTLICTVDNNDGVIVRGATDVQFRYETLGGRDWNQTTATDAVSVRTRIVMGNITDAQFVATSRAQVLAGVSP